MLKSLKNKYLSVLSILMFSFCVSDDLNCKYVINKYHLPYSEVFTNNLTVLSCNSYQDVLNYNINEFNSIELDFKALNPIFNFSEFNTTEIDIRQITAFFLRNFTNILINYQLNRKFNLFFSTIHVYDSVLEFIYNNITLSSEFECKNIKQEYLPFNYLSISYLLFKYNISYQKPICPIIFYSTFISTLRFSNLIETTNQIL